MNKQLKARAVIEALCGAWEMDAYSDWKNAKTITDKQFPVNKSKELMEKIQQIYMFAHAALPKECKHPDWDKKLEKAYKSLAKDGMCYTEKEQK